MKILGISGSPRIQQVSGTYKLVETVLENTEIEYELISLRGLSIGGCIACLGCAPDNLCKVHDDMTELRDKIVSADAYVVGAPNYYSMLNTITHAFLERWFQFRHQEGDMLWGKLGVAVGVGGMDGRPTVDAIEKFFMYNFIETTAKVTGQGAASCYSCGFGETCKVGLPVMKHGEGVTITESMIPDVEDQPETMCAAVEAGKQLGERLRNGSDRRAVTKRMQETMMKEFMKSM